MALHELTQRRTIGSTETEPEHCRSEERRVGKECKTRTTSDQAEDGIRDPLVTGVQTCALPISGFLGDAGDQGVGPRRRRTAGANSLNRKSRLTPAQILGRTYGPS